jgi:hypothetical protein
MMGTKERNFRSLPEDISLEELVPKDNFYRRLEEQIDLSFVRGMVAPLYAKGGRPSVETRSSSSSSSSSSSVRICAASGS